MIERSAQKIRQNQKSPQTGAFFLCFSLADLAAREGIIRANFDRSGDLLVLCRPIVFFDLGALLLNRYSASELFTRGSMPYAVTPFLLTSKKRLPSAV